MGIEGKVFVEFVINRDGSVTEVRAIKGIGAGCDEEAVRVIQNSPKWNPGKQRGKPVRQRMVLPVTFRLGN
jgi:protein TonB